MVASSISTSSAPSRSAVYRADSTLTSRSSVHPIMIAGASGHAESGYSPHRELEFCGRNFEKHHAASAGSLALYIAARAASTSGQRTEPSSARTRGDVTPGASIGGPSSHGFPPMSGITPQTKTMALTGWRAATIGIAIAPSECATSTMSSDVGSASATTSAYVSNVAVPSSIGRSTATAR